MRNQEMLPAHFVVRIWLGVIQMTLRNKNGFSLVELMVTVALIGILAAIGIPSYGRFRVKAYQSEAKSQLANLYVAQKSFYLEHNSYYSSLTAIGFAPAGRTRYNIGFGDFDSSVTTDFATPAWQNMSTKTICTGVGGSGTDDRCNMVMETPNMETALVVSQHSYVAGALSYEDLMVAQQYQANPNLTNLAQLVISSVTSNVYAIATSGSGGGNSEGLPTKCRQQTHWVDSWGIDQDKNILSKKLSPLSSDVMHSVFVEDGCSNTPRAASACPPSGG